MKLYEPTYLQLVCSFIIIIIHSDLFISKMSIKLIYLYCTYSLVMFTGMSSGILVNPKFLHDTSVASWPSHRHCAGDSQDCIKFTSADASDKIIIKDKVVVSNADIIV